MTLIPDLERDLIEAAGRRRSPRRLLKRALPPALSAVILGALVIALVDGPAGSDRPSTGNAVRDQDSAAPDQPPLRGPQPLRGTRSRPVAFRFEGTRYRMVGFRARGAVVCVRLERRPPGSPAYGTQGVTCAGERLLHRRLEVAPVLNVGQGGGAPHYMAAGFATARTMDVVVTGTRQASRVVLSAPWRPRGLPGEPIRPFIAVIAPPPSGRVPLRALRRIRVVPAR